MRKLFAARNCLSCGREFRPRKDNAKTCCSSCRQTLSNRRAREELARLREENKQLHALVGATG
jgi:hypothetical protein